MVFLVARHYYSILVLGESNALPIRRSLFDKYKPRVDIYLNSSDDTWGWFFDFFRFWWH